MTISGNIVNIQQHRIYAGSMTVDNGRISHIVATSVELDPALPYILPGFIDAHVHIESSMLVPAEFARLAVVHGTVATVSDPHEIANVCGIKGVDYMIENAKSVNFKFNFGAPSCVPATAFETAGDEIGPGDIDTLMANPEILYLSEMMNFPGVISRDGNVMKKIHSAQQAGKPVDGHAPGLSGEPLQKYFSAGISTDHECFTESEALEKLGLGMKILIREGSAAKNFEALAGLLHDHPAMMMFCSDDKHPDSLVKGHINELCRRAVARGINVFNVLQAACVNPVLHYRLNVGLLNAGDPADFIVVRNLVDFEVLQTFINGVCVAGHGKTFLSSTSSSVINRFDCHPVSAADIACRAHDFLQDGKLPVIEALDGQLITNKIFVDAKTVAGDVVGDLNGDVLKIVVVNRYSPGRPARAFIKNFGIQRGAIASSVAHDSHNIIAVGADDDSICRAINEIIAQRGGICCVDDGNTALLALPVGGLMSTEDGYRVADAYTAIDAMAKSLGSSLSAPFMTLSFMALLVIPRLKLSDKGLFDGESFGFVYP